MIKKYLRLFYNKSGITKQGEFCGILQRSLYETSDSMKISISHLLMLVINDAWQPGQSQVHLGDPDVQNRSFGFEIQNVAHTGLGHLDSSRH